MKVKQAIKNKLIEEARSYIKEEATEITPDEIISRLVKSINKHYKKKISNGVNAISLLKEYFNGDEFVEIFQDVMLTNLTDEEQESDAPAITMTMMAMDDLLTKIFIKNAKEWIDKSDAEFLAALTNENELAKIIKNIKKASK